MTREELSKTGAEAPDFVIVTGDQYIDHPSFGAAVIGRVLEAAGYSVGIISRPDAGEAADFGRFGRPRLAFLITAGSVDSLVANYSANKRRRRAGGPVSGRRPGALPDRACIVYTNRCKELYKDVPVVLGGIEASLRRLAHYDYWSDKVRRSVLLDSKADLLVYGMGERAIVEIANALNDGFAARDITWIAGTVFRAPKDADGSSALPAAAIVLPPYARLTDKAAYLDSFVLKYDNADAACAKPLAEEYDAGTYVVQNPPQPPLSTSELDAVYDLPYSYGAHPSYAARGENVPALNEIQFSISHVRGCYGGCAFCAITYHQGRIPTGRSAKSVVREAKKMAAHPGFKGYIHDVGGPTANIMGPACAKQRSGNTCLRKYCLWPNVCDRLDPDHGAYLHMLRAVAGVDGVKKVFVRSGIRHDLVASDRVNGKKFMRELAANHVSGLLKTAPEHFSPATLRAMRKPGKEVYDIFCREFEAADTAALTAARNKGEKRSKQYILPYFISGHPGSTLRDALNLTLAIEKSGAIVPDQIQDFYPTPGTLSTCLYYTGVDPFTREPVPVPGRDPALPNERELQRALLHHNKSENSRLVRKALDILGVSAAELGWRLRP
jgi:uncharacterized radical SAM protein YgiQ